ncbi:TAXI family TRAP transporter solute-binding subunit [Litorivicinus sp.]|nr:TAXI family TRAP transporter solute-binding subunit [Litorivicinus sp.]MDC1207837.1 TAXI family TRAP transporter solute-binding subunit [Litorivicinus sp.]MDC1239683.1 TAXI family TRAP transporter solute-binding subunit [Litorivicinus sp.]MDC1466474.1 TAXI family TRAP transporter solute-binding subunit [Litorivicinus sp.]
MIKQITKILPGLALALTITSVGAANQDYVLNTASTGGTYHPVGTAISTLSKIKLLPKSKFSLTAVNSAGSGANVQAMGSGTADFSILQGLYGSYASTGTGPISAPQKNLRAVSMLWQNVEQFLVANADVKGGTVSDLLALQGKGMGMGKQNSGTLGSNKVLLSGLGIDIDKEKLVYAGYGPTADALANGQIAVAGIPSGPPTGAITKLMASNSGKFTILNITADEAKKMDGGRQLWTPFTLKAGTYPGQSKDVQTVAQPNFLAVNASVDEEHVYLLTKTMYENLAFLQAIHPATNAMSINSAIAGLPVPLHPGAARYYKEVGLKIPGHLITK